MINIEKLDSEFYLRYVIYILLYFIYQEYFTYSKMDVMKNIGKDVIIIIYHYLVKIIFILKI